ncbi:serine hydrolase domain-containing protein [Nocardiopsis composta]
MRHLASHTSGLPDHFEKRRGGPSLNEHLAAGRDAVWTFEDMLRTTRERQRPHFEPQDLTAARQKARYSDTGFQLLIRIVETVTGRPFADLLTERILAPLGLERTWLPGHRPPDPATAGPSPLHAGRRRVELPSLIASSNDLYGTTGDLLAFQRALLAGGLFTDPRSLERLTERRNRLRNIPVLRYGLGTMFFTVGRLMSPGRRPVTLIGHSGATGTWLFHCPELDLHLAGTVDQTGGRPSPSGSWPGAWTPGDRDGHGPSRTAVPGTDPAASGAGSEGPSGRRTIRRAPRRSARRKARAAVAARAGVRSGQPVGPVPPGPGARPGAAGGTSRAPSAPAATTSAPAASTMSLKTYWASSVGRPPGNRSPKSSTSGDRIPTRAPASTARPVLSSLPVSSVIPMKHSTTAVTAIAVPPVSIPKVSISTVGTTSPSAGLAPGKNFSAPNARKVAPRLIRIRSMPCRASSRVPRAIARAAAPEGVRRGRGLGVLGDHGRSNRVPPVRRVGSC